MPFNFPQIRAFDPNNGGAIIEFLRRKFPCAKKVSILELQKVRREFPPVGRLADWLYENIYAPYTAKMWGVPIDQVDPNVISRVGVTLSDDESYFPGALLQGLPVGGYTAMIKRILDHPNIDLRLKTDGLKKLSLSGEGTI